MCRTAHRLVRAWTKSCAQDTEQKHVKQKTKGWVGGLGGGWLVLSGLIVDSSCADVLLVVSLPWSSTHTSCADVLPVVFLPWSSTLLVRTCCLLFLLHQWHYSDKQFVLYHVKEGEREMAPPPKRRRRRCRQHTCLHARMRAFFSCTVSCVTDVWLKAWTTQCVCAKVMSCLCHVSFGCSVSSVPCNLFFSDTTFRLVPSTPLTGTRRSPCALPPWCGMSGYLANPTPDTGYEPKFCVDARDEHKSINLSESNRNF